MPSVKNLILFDLPDDNQRKEIVNLNLNIFDYQDLIHIGQKSMSQLKPAKSETIHIINYTSGSTGDPKGVVLSHRNLVSLIGAFMRSNFFDFSQVTTHLSYLPLAHGYERCVASIIYYLGKKMGFYSGEASRIFEDIKILKPDIITGVPRIFQRIYEGIQKDVSKLTGTKKWLFNRAVSSKYYYLKKNHTIKYYFYDKLVFAKIKEALGGNVKAFFNGSAPVEPDLIDKFKIFFGCPFINGYGQTESTVAISMSNFDDPDSNSVGGPLPNTEIKLIDVPEMNYFSNRIVDGINLPQGEICFRGPNLFLGYFNNEAKTKEIIDNEGWAHSGDVGSMLPGGRLTIIDRIKNIFKLSQGEYIAPEKIENLLAMNEYISQVFITGNSLKNYIVGIIYPKKDRIFQLAKEKKIEGDFENLCKNKEILEEISKSIELFSKKYLLNSLETLKNYFLVTEPFSIENDTLTPTLKFKRYNVMKKYEKQIADLYK